MFNFQIVLADTGFKTADDVSGSTVVDSYSRSGAGAALKFPNGDTTDVKEIARGILVHCPLIFGVRCSVRLHSLSNFQWLQQCKMQLIKLLRLNALIYCSLHSFIVQMLQRAR